MGRVTRLRNLSQYPSVRREANTTRRLERTVDTEQWTQNIQILQNLEKIQHIQNMNYGIYINNKIKHICSLFLRFYYIYITREPFAGIGKSFHWADSYC